MTDRSASFTILGYLYQFDHTIKCILDFNTDTIDLECIEDIDINSASETTAIQCKYYGETEYNHSIIAKPIRLMLSDFANRKNENRNIVKYKIYGKYSSGQHKLDLPISIDFLKEKYLTYSKNDTKDDSKKKIEYKHYDILGLSDTDLFEFINHLNIDINAKEYREQQQEIFFGLKELFNCNDFEAEYFYYNNAFTFISKTAAKANQLDRRISKSDFINAINTKKRLFNSWFICFKDKKTFLKMIRENIFCGSLNTSPNERFFLIECSDDTDLNDVKHIILQIQNKWSKLSPRDSQSFCPYIYLHGISDNTLISLKVILRDESFYNIDGYDFRGAPFSAKSLAKQATAQNDIRLKFVNNLDELQEILNHLEKTKEVFEFFKTCPFFANESNNIRHEIIQVENIDDIKELTK